LYQIQQDPGMTKENKWIVIIEVILFSGYKYSGIILNARDNIVDFKGLTMKCLFSVLLLVGIASCTPKLSPDSNWSGRRWVLTEMKGVPVQLSGGRRDAYINFDAAEKRFSGNGGCNQISGSYNLEKKDIRFGEVISTKMSCQDIEFENTFLSSLNSVDRYEQKGNDLLLKKKKEVLLRFTVRNSGF
jgi:heat shock protein HslJ